MTDENPAARERGDGRDAVDGQDRPGRDRSRRERGERSRDAATTPATTITDVATVAVPVTDQDRARDFYVDTLGFEVRLDVPMPGGGRWLTVAPPGGAVALALTAEDPAAVGADTGIRFVARDVGGRARRARRAGVDVDAILDWPGVPPMFSFRDADGNTLYVVEAAS